MNFQIVFIAGPQGSGKGTQGKKLADKLGFLFWGMGGILRELESDVQFASKLALLDKGTLLPDELIIEILKERLTNEKFGIASSQRGIVFDGVPRRLGQAQFLVPFLHDRGYKNIATVFIDLPREDSIKRLVSRANTEGRADDTTDAIGRRFEYYDETMPAVINYLKTETEFFEIDGRPSVDEVERNVDAALGIG
jgi:adenylate kinase